MKNSRIKIAKNANLNVQISNKVIQTVIKSRTKKKWLKIFQKEHTNQIAHPLQKITKSYSLSVQKKRNMKNFLSIKNISSWNSKIKKQHNTFENFLANLDVSCWFSGLCMSVSQARHLISAGFVTVNGQKVFSGNFRLKEGDMVSIKKNSFWILPSIKYVAIKKIPAHLEVSFSTNSFVFCMQPKKHYIYAPENFLTT